MVRLMSLIRPNLVSRWTKINWSPDHRTPDCDYVQDSPSAGHTVLFTVMPRCPAYTMVLKAQPDHQIVAPCMLPYIVVSITKSN